MSVSVCMFALSTLRLTKFLLKNFTTTTFFNTGLQMRYFSSYYRASSYANAVLAGTMTVRLSHACFVTKPNNTLRIF